MAGGFPSGAEVPGMVVVPRTGVRRPFKWRVQVVGATVLAYLAIFSLSYHHLLWRATTVLCLVPVVTTGVLFGPRAGAVAGLLAFPVNFALLWLMGDWFDRPFIPSNFFTAHALFFVAGLLTGQLSLLRSRLEEELESRAVVEANLRKALAEVRTLQGLLPICTTCKKIRDGEGQWEPMEDYIGRRSGAEFSHSVCPDCVRQLYPDMDLS